ncbi:SUF system Fe-S cluster assembly regulator [Candidatus Nitrosacidococcus tergens]|uniref:FeS assembly SUF system regulator n=1 Tax=Candidatus Nitrosacidococcus tergens TaxID=553981 RepID=A0A7G1QAE8_9GAMM|nr:SUF system Fe-S cluster assembly regulator [Candidatus Nitrosacidococcus tergens]CAB1276626.1 FeS assembly SUF system regulator [Candidatus Nitrosacidococcus tergens]
MLRMSKMADYSIVIMTHLAIDPSEQCTTANLASQIGIPLPTVSKILKQLTRARLLTSTRGVQGGYHLAKPPAEISIIEIITIFEGPIGLTSCINMPGKCKQESYCTTRIHWKYINRAIYESLSKVKLSDMVRPVKEHPANPYLLSDQLSIN